MHLLAFGTLYTVAISLIALWFRYIDIKFPDPLNYYGVYGYEQLRWPMAVLIVVFPVFLFLSRWMNRGIAQDPARKELRIYRWLVNLTLFVTAVTVIIDLITLINNFLGGELTARFGLKVLVVLIVALGILGYYIWHLRADLTAARAKRKMLFWGAIIVVVGSIVAGFIIVGSPATARAQKFDQQRINDLQGIQYNVINYWQMNQKLPPTFNDLHQSILDPETAQPYEYRTTGAMSFELCAVFDADGAHVNPHDGRAYPEIVSWYHTKGRYCFPYTIDPLQYPKIAPVQVR